MEFRTRLFRTLRAVEPILREPGILVAGSEVPNLLEPEARSTLVVSQDVDIAVPVERHAMVKAGVRNLRDLAPSPEEPTVWLPRDPNLLEVNFIGMDAGSERAGQTYVLEDDELPLLVFGRLSLLRPGRTVDFEGLPVPVPRPAGLLLEKLLTDRSGEKGDRDLLVALALLSVCDEHDLAEVVTMYQDLAAEDRYAARSGLSVLSLLGPRPQMPDPGPHRARIAGLVASLEQTERGS